MIVTNKVSQFARNRREILHNYAKHLQIQVPIEFEAFMDAAESGRWAEVQSQFQELDKIRKTTGWSEGTARLWPVIMETFGVAEIAHRWPAEQLLDYGQAVLGSLRPDMVYVGGTDPGRFIPTLLNETSDGERHIVLTQNALADASYLQYLQFLYSDRFSALTTDDSKDMFAAYTTDAKKRLEHDQQFPNEPKQVLPGEDLRLNDNRFQVSGQTAVMDINEKLFQTLMAKNPGLSFAIEQSFPLKSTYAEAVPLGPIMELRAAGGANALTADLATQSVDYWNRTTDQLLASLADNDSLAVRQTYAKMAAEQASLLLAHKYSEQAEANLRLAAQICPSSPEVVFNYVSLLMNQSRGPEAIPLLENAMKASPDEKLFGSLLQQLKSMQSK
jgi:hypothetical protein